MTEQRVQRRLAAILAADVVGYSALMQRAEEATYTEFERLKRELIEPSLSRHEGRLIKTTGDGALAEFASPLAAVRCAVEIQDHLTSGSSPLRLRVGLNLGDVIVGQDGDLYGDGINIAVRLEGLANPGGILISEKVYSEVEGKLDIGLEDRGEQQLKNISKPVRAYAVRAEAHSRLTESISAAPPLPGKPSIAVLPFQNMSGDPEQEYFGDGIAEDIITTLSRRQSLLVIARNSSFTYKGRAVDVKQIARELGVRYVLEGSVRRGGHRVRISAQLVDAETGNHLWAERYDRDLVDIFAVQDEITEAVTIAIEPAVAEMERRRAVRKPPGSLSAWEAYQRGRLHVGRMSAADNVSAKEYFRRAIHLDPDFAAAHAWLANAIWFGAFFYQMSSIADISDEVVALAQRAVSLDPQNADSHSAISIGLYLKGDLEGAIAEARKALTISPDHLPQSILAAALTYSGRPGEGLEAARKALSLDPLLPGLTRMSHIVTALYYLRDYEAAIEVAKETLRIFPGHPIASRFLAAALGQAGRLDEASDALQRAITVAPKSFDMHVRQRVPWMRPEDYEHMLDGLRKAGWEG